MKKQLFDNSHYECSREVLNFLLGLFFSNRGCYSNWIASLQFCYYVAAHNWKRTWHEANKLCVESFRGNLASIGSQEEYDFLEGALEKKQVSTCLYIGLKTSDASLIPSWEDGNFWNFSKLSTGYDQENRTNMCVYRGLDGWWYLANCSDKCGFICKKYRGDVENNHSYSRYCSLWIF